MIQFNDTTNLRGLVQLYEKECGYNYGDVSGNTTLLKQFTADVNNALDTYFSIAIRSAGTWELDDSNHGDYAVIYTTLTAGRRDYSFLTDASGNAVLDIYKVLVLPSATATQYEEIYPVDENQRENLSIINEDGSVGSPLKYAKRSNAIHFDVEPNYTVARGIKVLINRTSSYFTYTDTTEKAGYPYHHEYFYLKPAYIRARGPLQLPNKNDLEKEILKLEGNPITGQVGYISIAYGGRKKDEMDSISGEYVNSV